MRIYFLECAETRETNSLKSDKKIYLFSKKKFQEKNIGNFFQALRGIRPPKPVKVHLKGNSGLKNILVAKRSLGYSKTFFTSDIFFAN